MIARLALALTFLSLQPAWAASRIYSIDSKACSVQAHVGKTGIGSFAGDWIGRRFTGQQRGQGHASQAGGKPSEQIAARERGVSGTLDFGE